MEVREPLKHPAQDAARKIIQKIMSRGRRFADWEIEMLEYDFYSSIYRARLSLDGSSAVAKIPSEWIDSAHNNDNQGRRKVKHALRDAVKAFYQMEEEDD